MTIDQTFPNAVGLLRMETLKELSDKLNQPTCSIVDGWAVANPKRLKELEASGGLLARAQKAELEEAEAQQRAVETTGQRPPLSSWEMAEVYGGASRTLF